MLMEVNNEANYTSSDSEEDFEDYDSDPANFGKGVFDDIFFDEDIWVHNLVIKDENSSIIVSNLPLEKAQTLTVGINQCAYNARYESNIIEDENFDYTFLGGCLGERIG